MKKATQALVMLIFTCFSLNAWSAWRCTDAAGHVYTASQSVRSDSCIDITTDEERAAEPKIKVERSLPPFKSKTADARKAMTEGKRAIAESLKDGDSARFRNLLTARDVFLCGEVNAKNSMGGYVGFKKFIALGEVDLVWFDDGSDKFSDRWFTSCEGFTQAYIDEQRRLLQK